MKTNIAVFANALVYPEITFYIHVR